MKSLLCSVAGMREESVDAEVGGVVEVRGAGHPMRVVGESSDEVREVDAVSTYLFAGVQMVAEPSKRDDVVRAVLR